MYGKGRLLALMGFMFVVSRTLLFPETIEQQLDLTMGQTAGIWGLGTENPLNRDNWQEQKDWETEMEAALNWHIRFSNRLLFDFSGSMAWMEMGGFYNGGTPVYESPLFALDESLLNLNIHEAGIRVMAGKTMRKQGTALLLPVTNFLYDDTLEPDRDNHGKWMAGFSLYQQGIFFEGWAAPAASWVPDAYSPYAGGESSVMVLLNGAYTFDVHRLGLLYYYNGAHKTGLYYSGQIGTAFIPYGEAAISNHSMIKQFVPGSLYVPPDTWSFDMVLGGSYAFSRLNGTLYMEYRYRSSGYDANDWQKINTAIAAQGLNHGALGLMAQSLPRLYTTPHTIGFRIQNTLGLLGTI